MGIIRKSVNLSNRFLAAAGSLSCSAFGSEYNRGMATLRIPIYPSSQVIFPGQLLVLSDPQSVRQAVLRVCRDKRMPLGVVWASGEQGNTLARVGTLVYLLKPQPGLLGAEELVVGQSRFRILQIHQDHAYLESTVQIWPWLEEPRPAWTLVEQLGQYLRRYVNAWAEAIPSILMPEMLEANSATLGVLGGALLQLPMSEKQRLLEIPTAQVLLSMVLKYMRIHVPLTERLAAMRPHVPDPHGNISPN